MHSQNASCSEICAWIDILKAEFLPEFVIHVSSLEVSHHILKLIVAYLFEVVRKLHQHLLFAFFSIRVGINFVQ